MMTERVYAFWGLLFIAVPMAASTLRGGWTRVDQVFTGVSILATFLLMGFAPRIALSVGGWILCTLAVSIAMALLYAGLSPASRSQVGALLAAVGAMDAAALTAIYFATSEGLGHLAFSGVLLAAVFAAGFAAIKIARRFEQPARIQPGKN